MGTGHGPSDELGRRAVVAGLMAGHQIEGETVTVVDLLGRLCRAAATHLSVVRVAMGLRSESGSEGVVASSDAHSVLLDELQFSLGEGPGHDAFVTRRPVLVADLASSEGHAWPMFSAGALEAGAAGVCAFPLRIGASTLGVFTLYTHGGLMVREPLAMAFTFADVAAEILLDGDADSGSGGMPPAAEAAMGHRVEIYQAQGMVGVKLGISLAESLARMRAHAFSHGHTLAELAVLILAGEVNLASPPED